MDNSRLVYSTETGRICQRCGNPMDKCRCGQKKTTPASGKKRDGVIRLQREKKGRKGKTVTVVTGFSPGDGDLKQLASRLKNRCGCGGSVKGEEIIIQGDHRDILLAELSAQGFKVKLSGG